MDYKAELINLAYKFRDDNSTCGDDGGYICDMEICNSCTLNEKICSESDITFCQVLIGILNGDNDELEDYEDGE